VIARSELDEDEVHELEIQGDELRIDRFAWGPVEGIPPGEIELTGGVVQPGAPRAEVYVAGRFAGVGNGEEKLRLAARVTGCLFRTLVPLVPPNTDTVLGGAGFDADVETRWSGGVVDLVGAVATSGGSKYHASVQGPVDDPRVEVPDKLLSVASRMRGGAGRLVRSTIGGGSELVKGTAKAAGDLGAGGFSAVGRALEGVAQTTVGLLSADEKKAREGVSSMTVGAGREAKEAVDTSTGRIVDAGGGTSQALAHDPGLVKWLDGIAARHAERTRGLLDSLRQEALPGPG
jgi:hypothetical protein